MSTNISKSDPEFWDFVDKTLSAMPEEQLDRFQKKIDTLLEEKARAELAQTMTEEQLLKLYNGFGFYPKDGDKFWKIRATGKGQGFYGWQVGQFEHSCHIDTTDLIVLYVIEPGTPTNPSGPEYVAHFSELWLDGPIIVGGKKKEAVKPVPTKRALDAKEKAKGRSEGYWEMSPADQWAEDKRLGILDWDDN